MTTMLDSPATRVRMRLREELIAALRAALDTNPPAEGTERVILFGSVARGDFEGTSDVDLMVVGGDGAIEGSALWQAVGHRDVDVIHWRREAWARALAQGHPFARDIAREGVELWRAPDAPPLRP